MIEIHPLPAIGEVRTGADLAAVLVDGLAAAGVSLRPHDIVIVTQKIVSKAEGRFVALADVIPGAEALRLAEVTRKDPRLVELVLRESTDVVRAVPNVLITRHRLGLVMANSGIDRSNLGPGRGDSALLLPVDPDASADRLRTAIGLRTGTAPAIIISDSFGRPWRYGVVSVAIGAAGLAALIDRRGDLDRDARTLEVTQVALGDIVATAASLATGEGAEGVPAALVRGVALTADANPATTLVRPLTEDLFQ